MRTTAETSLGYVPALDGVRGVCILAVLLHHAGVPLAHGGFLGVDGFFTLSGYLITSLLLQEHIATGGISIRRFYLRRALRLLPALFVLLAAVGTGLLLFRPPQPIVDANVRGIWSSLLYVSNWVKIAVNAPEAYDLGILGHTWSLAIEEQFYLSWPLLLMLLLRRAPHKLAYALVVLIIGSWLVRVSLLVSGVGPGAYRVYDGTDTRADAILMGCLLAVILSRWPLHWRLDHVAPYTRAGLCVGLPLLAWMWLFGDYGSSFFYLGGFTLDAILVAVVIFHVRISPQGKLSHILSLQPLTRIGLVAYGLYLWHWPLYQVFPTQDWFDWPIQLLRAGVLLFCVLVSFRYVELPFLKFKTRFGRANLRQSTLPNLVSATGQADGAERVLTQ